MLSIYWLHGKNFFSQVLASVWLKTFTVILPVIFSNEQRTKWKRINEIVNVHMSNFEDNLTDYMDIHHHINWLHRGASISSFFVR